MYAALIQFSARYVFQIIGALIIIGVYFGWAHHQQSIGFAEAEAKQAKVDARIADESSKLMAHEKELVEKSNQELNERIKNATTIFAQRAVEYNSDVDNLTKRLRRATKKTSSCNKDPVSGVGNDDEGRESGDRETDREIAEATVQLMNNCEELKNKVPTTE